MLNFMEANMSLINLPRTKLDVEREKETEETRGEEQMHTVQ